MPAASTPFAVDDLIKRYTEAVAAGEHHPVLLSGLFILDLLVIHPFEDGNGRVDNRPLQAGACREYPVRRVGRLPPRRYEEWPVFVKQTKCFI